MLVLVTGGLGYIGRYVCAELIKSGHRVRIYDIKKNNSENCIQGDIVTGENLFEACRGVDAVIHMAALINVEESMRCPYWYYETNVTGTKNLLKCMEANNVRHIVFSSTAAVYGKTQGVVDENTMLNPCNVYGHTKLMAEKIINNSPVSSVCLRYFNAAGGDENHIPETHLIPNLISANLNDKVFKLFGNDYDTEDGTCVRDYISVFDLAQAHIRAVEYNGSGVFNLGTELGISIRNVIAVVESITGKKTKIEICPKREGDPPVLIADSGRAKRELNWKTYNTLNDIVQSVVENSIWQAYSELPK